MAWFLAPLFGTPRYVWAIAGIAGLVVAFVLWLNGEKREAVAAAAAVASAVAVTRARKADQAAAVVAESKAAEVEATNRAAIEAANADEDALKAAMDKLRERK